MSGFGERLGQRQKAFKKTGDADESRRKREDAVVQLRKQAKEEALLKKRLVDEASLQATTQAASPTTAAADEPRIPQVLVDKLLSDDPQENFTVTQLFRKFLSKPVNPPIAEVVALGLVPRFVHFLRDVSRPLLQFEAAWVLTNVASGTAEQTRAVVEQGALPIFVELLQSPSEDVREQSIWALGNIAGDSPQFRDLVIQSGGVGYFVALLAGTSKDSMLRNAAWALSNLCRAMPPPVFELVAPAGEMFARLITSNDAELISDACWGLHYLSNSAAGRPQDRGALILQCGAVPRLVELLRHNSPLVQTPAIRVLGNISSAGALQTQAIIQAGALGALEPLMSHTRKAVRKDACFLLSNVAAGGHTHIQELLAAGLLAPVLAQLATADFDVKQEAARIVSNIATHGNAQQVEQLVTSGAVKPLVDVLGAPDVKAVCVALEALERILAFGGQSQRERGAAENPCGTLVEQADGLRRLEALQESASEEVYQRAVRIITAFFPSEDGVDGSGNPGMQFGVQAPQAGFNFQAGAPQGLAAC